MTYDVYGKKSSDPSAVSVDAWLRSGYRPVATVSATSHQEAGRKMLDEYGSAAFESILVVQASTRRAKVFDVMPKTDYYLVER